MGERGPKNVIPREIIIFALDCIRFYRCVYQSVVHKLIHTKDP